MNPFLSAILPMIEPILIQLAQSLAKQLLAELETQAPALLQTLVAQAFKSVNAQLPPTIAPTA